MTRDRIDIMTDLETLGTGTDALIIQVSAIPFDVNTGEVYMGEKFNMCVDLELTDNMSGIEGKTLKWWLHEDRRDLLADLLTREDSCSLTGVLSEFVSWIRELQKEVGDKNLYLWGNGILFDNAKLQRNIENIGWDYPIHYQNDRDQRTLLELALSVTGYTKEELIDEIHEDAEDNGFHFVLHDAIDDCHFQINTVIWCKNAILQGEKLE